MATVVSPGLFIASVISLLLVVGAQKSRPSCEFHGETNLLCSPGKKDYILQRGLVSDNNRTTSISLRGCRISGIGLESFTGLSGLKNLDLSMNQIQRLRLGALDGARYVTHLNLSHNMISELPLGVFDQKPNLIVLDLKSNRISDLKLGIFDPFSKLNHLDLSSNPLLGKDINSFLFDRSQGIRFIDFSRNDMRDTSEFLLRAFEELDFINLDRCSLTEVPKFVTKSNLKTMKHLMLSTNHIIQIDDPNTFKNLQGLEILNLVDNSIENLDDNVFKPLKKLKMVLLRNNKLKHLSDQLFNNLIKLINLDLSHNLIEYVPVNAFRGSGLKNLNLSDNRFTYLTDNFCLELKNSGTILNKFYFNQNPWQCACLKDIVNEVKSLRIEYNANKYDGTVPVCVSTTDFICKRHQNDNQIYVQMYLSSIGNKEILV